MRFQVSGTIPGDFETPLLAVLLFEGERQLPTGAESIDSASGGAVGRVLSGGDFKGREGQALVLYPGEGSRARRLLLIGLGKRERYDAERLRRAAATAARQAARIGTSDLAFHLRQEREAAPSIVDAARAVAEGFELGSYVFDAFKTRGEEEPARVERVDVLVAEDDPAAVEHAIRIGSASARAENLARDLGNTPGNVATPTYLADRAVEIAGRHGMKVEILGPAEMREHGLNALLAVAAGSVEEPRLIVLEHRRGPAGSKPIVLVGKGLTFDSGGISIKPAQGMEEMKFDMCGGAAVLAAMDAIGELQIEIDVIGVVPSSENLLSGAAMKPGDIIRAHSGKTIEVVNTDAEGRLILADALSYARRYEPAALIDVATLTGSCVIALGSHASGAMGNDDALLRELQAAGDRVGERIWPLPMHDEYREQIKSDYADIKNSGGRPAGTITAGWFLREFVGDAPWVHLDIAGTANGDGKLPYHAKGATGVPTRLLVDWVLSRAG
jgi:leucyl aminopeptidase